MPPAGAVSRDRATARRLQNEVEFLKSELENEGKLKDDLLASLAASDDALRSYKKTSRERLADVERQAQDDIAELQQQLATVSAAKNKELLALEQKNHRLATTIEELQQDVVAAKQRELQVQATADQLKRELETTKVRAQAWVEQAEADRAVLFAGGGAGGGALPGADVTDGTAADVTARAVRTRMEAAIRKAHNETVFVQAQWDEERKCREELEKLLAGARADLADAKQLRARCGLLCFPLVC